jgi:hypothetical protein
VWNALGTSNQLLSGFNMALFSTSRGLESSGLLEILEHSGDKFAIMTVEMTSIFLNPKRLLLK